LHAAQPVTIDRNQRSRSPEYADVLWDHAKVGLQFQPGTSPRELENAEQAWIIKFGPPDTDAVQMILAKGI
jgi:hypothetical protein